MADNNNSSDGILWFMIIAAGIGIAILVSGSSYTTFEHDNTGITGTVRCDYDYSEKYIVQPGDCASGIVERYHIQGKRVSFQKFITVNNLVLYTDEYGNQWCDLQVGQELIIPIDR